MATQKRPQPRADSLVHPVRLRIVQLLGQGRALSAKEIGEQLGDVAHATLYRHVRALAEHGWLQVESEEAKRGGVEVRYRVAGQQAIANAQDLAHARPADHLRWFTTFTAHLLGAFSRYLDARADDIDLARDGVGYHVTPLDLSDAEFERFTTELRALIERYHGRPSSSARKARLLATVLMPDLDRGGL